MTSVTDAAAVVEAFNRLTLAFQPRSASGTNTAAGAQPAPVGTNDSRNGAATEGSVLAPAEHSTATGPPSDPIYSELPELFRGIQYRDIDRAIAEALAATAGCIQGGYDISCPIPHVAASDDAMDWQPADEGVFSINNLFSSTRR